MNSAHWMGWFSRDKDLGFERFTWDIQTPRDEENFPLCF